MGARSFVDSASSTTVSCQCPARRSHGYVGNPGLAVPFGRLQWRRIGLQQHVTGVPCRPGLSSYRSSEMAGRLSRGDARRGTGRVRLDCVAAPVPTHRRVGACTHTLSSSTRAPFALACCSGVRSWPKVTSTYCPCDWRQVRIPGASVSRLGLARRLPKNSFLSKLGCQGLNASLAFT